MPSEEQAYSLARDFLNTYDQLEETDGRLQGIYEGHVKKAVSLARGSDLGDAVVKVLRREGSDEVRELLDTLSGDDGRVSVAMDQHADNKVTYF